MSTLTYQDSKMKYDGSEIATKGDIGVIHAVASGDLSGAPNQVIDSTDTIKTKEIPSCKRINLNRRIVAINHDDTKEADYLGISKIYAKYGFHASFNFILIPFANATEMQKKISGMKQIISDGNDIGLHAILGESAWWMNKMYDVRPDETFTFAPTLSELQTVDANNKNCFNQTVTSSTLVNGGESSFMGVPSSLSSVKVLEMTSAQMVTLIKYYCVYFMTDTVSGLDLTGTSRTWSILKWLEYWYNELIDDTLGYSSESTVTSEKYASDYTGTYPSAQELLSGTITSNGVFTKGLFKGCQTCCNYEVADRLIAIAEAFCQYYFGLDHFRNHGRHGARFANCLWYDSDGTPWDNRDKSVLAGEFGKVYRTRTKNWVTEHDILLDAGIRVQNHNTPLNAIYEAQVGLYYGQDGIRSPFFNSCSGIPFCMTSYFYFLTTSNGGTVPYNDYVTFTDGIADLISFAYENAGQTLTRNGVTLKVTHYIKKAIDNISSAWDTGKIPCMSLDTIHFDAPTMEAVDIFFAWCWKNGVDVVTMEEARQMAITHDIKSNNNLFPNPMFNQRLLSFQNDIPDSWRFDGGSSLSYDVDSDRALKVTCNGGSTYAAVSTCLYGIKAGSYKLSFYAKKFGEGTCIARLFAKKNSDTINQYYFDGSSHFSPVSQETISESEYTLVEMIFTIPERLLDLQNTAASQYAKGYQNNVSRIVFSLNFGSGSNFGVYIKKPVIKENNA